MCGFDTALRSSDSDDGMPDEAFESIFDKNAAILDVPLEMYDSSNVDLPTVGSKIVEMPVFMLDLAVCPGGVVPLHIFEMRYRQMMNDIGAKDNRFGMLVSDPETGTPCKYGAVLECAQRKLLPDGRQYLLNQAVERFRVLRVVTTKPYTVMQIEVGIPDDPYVEGEGARWGVAEGTSLAELEMQVFDTVNTVVELMNKLAPPMDVNEKRTLSEWFKTYAPKKTMDEGVEPLPEGDKQEHERRMKFSYAVAEMISMSPHTKQLLVQSRSTTYRLKAELEILMKAQKELAARCSLKDTLG